MTERERLMMAAVKSVLVTGGTGTFGQAFVRHILTTDVQRVAIFSRSEAKQATMKATFTDPRMRYMIGDVRDPLRVMDALRGIDTVIHAAALKRVEVCEGDPHEAVLTNVQGTANVARGCIERGVSRAVFLSTDKAAAPNTLYGTTKLAGERLWVGSNVYAAGTVTLFAATRYGNVMGSTGSVVPLWKAQALSGIVTVTDPNMTRFFMSIDEAVELVCMALRTMRGGEVFVPKLKACSLSELARVVVPGATIAYTGPRPGEKMHETLITEDEESRTTEHEGHYVIHPTTRGWEDEPPMVLVDSLPKRYRSDTVERFTGDELRTLTQGD